MEIREATSNDVNDLARLMCELGYPTTFEQMKVRFNDIVSTPHHYTLLACIDGKVVAMIGFHTGHLYNMDGMYARIVAFVVDSSYRNLGIGTLLLRKVEEFTKKLGVDGIVLNSGNRAEREIAHKFYESHGYLVKSTGFVKTLNEL
ncbi:GNAT family N-acetyltransferase [Metabacillus malikii]|uniref:GNAT superfamily N-acetyltransferase n=1 Tax=Metabacillus malikii TaxID=1504265 RepID=A0ABT9Z9W3_9BACI|nr:GNAT family N-acetyltransferase [Metabacillus malikii]MDQ0229036.1 GNAT superfamily N-acetyltransferase [Metabacillus malikii]